MNSEATVHTERALLGTLIADNSLWRHTEELTVDDFFLDCHRKIFRAMCLLNEDGGPIDPVTVASRLAQSNQLASCGDVAYVSSLIDHGLSVNFAAYVRDVRLASTERRTARLIERLPQCGREQQRELIREIQELLSHASADKNWRTLFHSYDEIMNAPMPRFVIENFLQEDGITAVGGLSGHGKTLTMLAIARALLEGEKLFHHFRVNKTAERVIYLIPEAALAPFAGRIKMFCLQEHIRAGRLFCRTLSAQGALSLTDPRLLEAVRGADLFLDTAIRFMEASDENSATEQKIFADTLFALQRAGARTIVAAHHSPKAFGKDSYMALENVLRGSGDIGAMLATCWGLSQIDATTNSIYIQNVKARDFNPCEPFIVKGRPTLDENGYFELTHPPGFAGKLSDNKRQPGRPESTNKEFKVAEARRMKADGSSHQEIADELNIAKSTVSKWLNVS